MTRKQIIGAVVVAVAAIVALAIFLERPEPSYDGSWDTRVADPAYRGGGPVVLFDEGHRNTHTTDEGYRPLADLLRSDGYTLRVREQPFTAQALEGVAVLVLPLARGANDANDEPAYTEAEGEAIERWVRAGGSLLLVTDHWPYGVAVSSLARRFDVSMGGGLVEDPDHHDPERGASHLVFSVDNGLLRDHPIVRGRTPAERVRRVLTFTGQSLGGPPSSTSFLGLSGTAVEWPPGPPRVQRDGGDVRVEMQYGEPASAAGRSQGLALEVERGRIVVLGEAGMLRAQRERNGMLVGMNVSGCDNRQLALNIMHWLSRAL